MKNHNTALLISLVFIISCGGRGVRNDAFLQGEKQYYNQQFDKALPLLLKAHKNSPEKSTTCFYLGNIYNHHRLPSQALSFYKKGLQFTKKPAHFYFNIGLTFSYLKKYKKAISNFSQALSKDPGLVNAHLDMGLAYFRRGELKKTISHWELYLKSSPTNSQAGTIKKAIQILKKRAAH